ncbi:MAG TPA: 50S ribosomal protein L24 [Candidatus Dormibacteraeota bacterium]|nr:50S ribosomal protein L24 [Candidatus Dormibacteraeota bacterium]
MKLKLKDKVLVIAGKDKGKTGEITAVLPKEGKVVVDKINVAKRHTKPSNKNPRGGILEINRPIDISKLMVIDPATGQPSRVGYKEVKGVKERYFKPTRRPKVKKSKE